MTQPQTGTDSASRTTPAARLRLGLPAWAFPGWKHRYFPAGTNPLAAYSQVFDAVEGNTSFYRIPDRRSVDAWREAIAGRDFRMCFKLPRSVTHERAADRTDLTAFLRAVEPFGDSLGPLLVQLPARVGPDALGELDLLFAALPRDWRAVIEVRNRAFFTDPGTLDPLLERYRVGRVTLDTRALYRGDRNHPDVVNALHEKPDLPILPRVYNGLAFIRLVLHPDRLDNQRYLDEWAARVAEYLDGGADAFVMIHCPDNLHCPDLAAQFHQTLRATRPDLLRSPLPPWPQSTQASLF